MRLYPPTTTAYFVELLAMPAEGQANPVRWEAIKLAAGWYGVPSFRFMRLLECEQCASEEGIRYASPRMMALANALSHRKVGSERMSGEIGGRSILRSAKDLGRVLGIVWLEKRVQLEAWPRVWLEALQACFPSEWSELAAHAGDGLRQVLKSEDVLEEAHHSLVYGLLRGKGLSIEMLASSGAQFADDVLDPLSALATSAGAP